MRTSRRFRPTFECMLARIAPSTISITPPVAHPTVHMVAAQDSTGNPATNPSSGGTGPVIFTPPAGKGGIGGVC
jgi:hypothetical protein